MLPLIHGPSGWFNLTFDDGADATFMDGADEKSESCSQN
jgi:hypothetical protein